MLKVVGAGLSKTGTTSLHRALQILGFRSLHYDIRRWNQILAGIEESMDFRLYDDYDAVSDLPAAFFYKELLQAYPGSKAILTIRDPDAWFESIAAHFNERRRVERVGLPTRILARVGVRSAAVAVRHWRFRTNLRHLVYGSLNANEFIYKKRYEQHNRLVTTEVPADRLLVMDVTRGDGWEKLCSFLEVPVPDTPFPYMNKADYQTSRAFDFRSGTEPASEPDFLSVPESHR